MTTLEPLELYILYTMVRDKTNAGKPTIYYRIICVCVCQRKRNNNNNNIKGEEEIKYYNKLFIETHVFAHIFYKTAKNMAGKSSN